MTVDEHVYDFLEHRGVKGMHWGVRKSNGDKPSSKKPSRQEKREAKTAAREKKVNDLVSTSLKEPTALILLNGRHLITGEEFVNHMTNGGLMDVRLTRVYARQHTKEGPYVLEPKS